MAPGRELWTWTTPAGTDRFEVLVDGAAPQIAVSDRESRLSLPLELGEHMLEVRACDVEGRCSTWASHTTLVESFGEDLPTGLRGTARILPATALGHRLAIGCNDCADGLKSEVLSLAGAAASIERALDRGADLIELNVASIADDLYASPADAAEVGARPLLAALLGRPKLGDSDTILAFEIVEGVQFEGQALPPDEFAQALFALIDAAPNVARNGRPLWLRASYGNRQYLRALAAEAAYHTITGPYVRLLVSDPGGEPAAFYSGDVLVPDLDFLDAVTVDFRLPNLPFRLERIRAAGAAAIVDNVPGPFHGEIVLAALREQVDAFIANYRVDQARSIIEKPDTGSYFGARDFSADGRWLTIRGIHDGVITTSEQELGKEPPSDVFGSPTPKAAWGVLMDSLFGPYLDFSGFAGLLAFPVPSGGFVSELQRSKGFLVAVSGVFPSRSDEVATIAWSPSPAFKLQVTQDGRVRLFAAGSSQEKDRELVAPSSQLSCTSRNGVYAESLDLSLPHWIVGAYDGGLRFSLFIDGGCAGEFETSFDVEGYTGQAMGLGVDERAVPFFRGGIQQASSLLWEPAMRSHGEN